MNTVEGIGYLAASLVLATFCMKSMGALRLAAIASNIAFITYGYLGHLAPVLLLHALLLPINIYRLVEPVSPDHPRTRWWISVSRRNRSPTTSNCSTSSQASSTRSC